MRFSYFYIRPFFIESIDNVFSIHHKSEHQYDSSINNESQKKIKIIIVLKMNALAVFHSHWSCVADTNLLLFLIGSTDQWDRFCPTVSRVFGFWLNASLRPRGKQKNCKTFVFFRVWDENLVAARGDYDVLFVLQCVLWCVMRCDGIYSFFALLFCALLCRCDVLCCVVMCCTVLLCVGFFCSFSPVIACDMCFFCVAVLSCAVLWCDVMCCVVLSRSHMLCVRALHMYSRIVLVSCPREFCMWVYPMVHMFLFFVFTFFHSFLYFFFARTYAKVSWVVCLRVSCEPQTCAVFVSCLRFLFFVVVFFVFGLTRCFRARTVCAIVTVCSHADATCTCACVCHACVFEFVMF